MDQQTYLIELVKKAQQGDKNSLDQLAMQVKDRLRTYVLRMTQQEDLAQDIVQESLLEMFKVIGKLRDADKFWPWLYGIATNKLRRFYRTEATQRRVAVASLESKGSASPEERDGGFEDLVGDELKQIVSNAMKKLKTSHKAVLLMRCYDEMPYSEIAETMGCSEFSTRMLFLRAKRALQKELSRNGFGKGSFLAALIIFGKMTAPTKAAAAEISIAAATIKVGVAASTVGLITSKSAIVSIAAAGILTTSTVVIKPELFNLRSAKPQNPNVLVTNLNGAGQNADINVKYQWFFPKGPKEPVMMQAEFGSVADNNYRKILQNQLGNYYYNGNSVNINNYHMYNEDLSVIQMPTDDPDVATFISKVEDTSKKIQHISASGRGLLVIDQRNANENGNNTVSLKHSLVPEEDYFRADWPANANVVDNRDEMHKRGWTYFRVEGNINGKDINGRGRIPFIYSAIENNSPWIRLQIDRSLLFVDTSDEAYIYYRNENDRVESYPGGSFLKGMARPWMGLHAIDTVRRDAAVQGIKFDTEYVEGTDRKNAQVKLITDDVTFIYNIDLENDVINEINFSTSMGITGSMKFTYLQNVNGLDVEFSIPDKPTNKATSMESQGLLWLTKLLED